MEWFTFRTHQSQRWVILLFLVMIVVMTLLLGRGIYAPVAADSGGYNVVFLVLLYLNLFAILALGVLVVRSLVRLWIDRRQQLAGARLRARMAYLFAALSLLPTLVVSGLSVELLNRGVDSWFSDRISSSLHQSVQVARAYYREAQRTVKHDAEDMVRNRRVTTSMTLQRSDMVRAVLEAERVARGLDEIAIVQTDGTRIAVVGDLPFDSVPDLMPLLDGTLHSLLITDDTGTWVRAFVPISHDQFLSTGRWIDRQILAQMEAVETAYVDYQQLRKSQGLLKSGHTMTLVAIALLLLMVALWSGLRIADSLTDPITRLVVGTQRVAEGDLSMTLEITGDDELATLMHSFNAMTRKLGENRKELQSTNALLEERRRFMAAILQHVSSGVLRVDMDGVITSANPAAVRLLAMESVEHVIGRPYHLCLPGPVADAMDMLLDVLTRPEEGGNGTAGIPSVQIRVEEGERPLTLLARVTILEAGDGSCGGFIATFDDLTDVLIAQRSHTWIDVARRIAHEIRNPLTPIQLWTQRMRRKYLRPVTDGTGGATDWRILDEGTDVIIRQVEELRILLDEFSSFARMPRPHLQPEDLNATVQETLMLYDADLQKIDLTSTLEPDLPRIPLDRGQMKRALSNLITNALAAVREKLEKQPDAPGALEITTSMVRTPQAAWIRLQIGDSGSGIPVTSRDLVLEPYFTTKKRGTGLGLAIVKKIVEDHGGALRLCDSRLGGALIEVSLPVSGPATTHRALNTGEKEE